MFHRGRGDHFCQRQQQNLHLHFSKNSKNSLMAYFSRRFTQQVCQSIHRCLDSFTDGISC